METPTQSQLEQTVESAGAPSSTLRMVARKIARYAAAITLVGCAGLQRECSSCNAESFAADWLVAQYDYQWEAN